MNIHRLEAVVAEMGEKGTEYLEFIRVPEWVKGRMDEMAKQITSQ